MKEFTLLRKDGRVGYLDWGQFRQFVDGIELFGDKGVVYVIRDGNLIVRHSDQTVDSVDGLKVSDRPPFDPHRAQRRVERMMPGIRDNDIPHL